MKTLSSNNDLRCLSPVLTHNDASTTKDNDSFLSLSSPTVDIQKEINDGTITTTNVESDGNELEKKDRPIVDGTNKVVRLKTRISMNHFFKFCFISVNLMIIYRILFQRDNI